MIVNNVIYVDGKQAATPDTLEETSELKHASRGMAWIGLYNPTPDEFRAVADEFGIHELAVDDAIQAHQRPKIEQYGDIAFIVLRTAHYVDPEEIIAHSTLLVRGAVRLASHARTKSMDMTPELASVIARLGEDLSKTDLGGWEIQCRAGAIDHAVDTEEEAFDCARKFLSYLPSSVHELPPVLPAGDPADRPVEKLMKAIPRNQRQVYKMRPIIETVVDEGSFFEMGQMFGRSIITGFARLQGRPVALLASDPYHYGGAWTAEACQKIVRFVDMAQTFHLPVVYLCDCPGFMIGLQAEQTATIRHGVRAMAALNQTDIPWCTIIVRNCFGVAGAAHQPAGRLSLRYAWLSARWGSLPLEGGIEAAYRADLDASPDPKAKLAEIEERLAKLRTPFRTAETFWVEDIIDPRETRRLLCDFAELAYRTLTPGLPKASMRP